MAGQGVLHELEETEQRLLDELRAMRRNLRRSHVHGDIHQLTLGQRIADTVAATMGSWNFIIIQSMITRPACERSPL